MAINIPILLTTSINPSPKSENILTISLVSLFILSINTPYELLSNSEISNFIASLAILTWILDVALKEYLLNKILYR